MEKVEILIMAMEERKEWATRDEKETEERKRMSEGGARNRRSFHGGNRPLSRRKALALVSGKIQFSRGTVSGSDPHAESRKLEQYASRDLLHPRVWQTPDVRLLPDTQREYAERTCFID